MIRSWTTEDAKHFTPDQARDPARNRGRSLTTKALAFRFGLDPGVAAMADLAFVSWPLGEVGRAVSLIDRMQTRMADLAHVGTLAFGRMHAAAFELMRGDHARATPNAFEARASRART